MHTKQVDKKSQVPRPKHLAFSGFHAQQSFNPPGRATERGIPETYLQAVFLEKVVVLDEKKRIEIGVRAVGFNHFLVSS